MDIDESVFHAGEQAIQRRVGVFDEIGPWARKVVRPTLPDQHRAFYAELPFLVAAARDAQGRPWATLLTGEPGFVRSSGAGRLEIDARPPVGDGLDGALDAGADLGLLGIELATRRRNRVNGSVRRNSDAGLELEVGQSFGNCPQYIREREWVWVEKSPFSSSATRSNRIDAGLRERIESADTFFIATGHTGDGSAPSHGMDASHRGGPVGFVRVDGDDRIVFPDYDGNKHFNTIGNLETDSRAGLLFVDFESGGMLQLTGRARVDWDSEELSQFEGAQRLIRFELDEAIDGPGSLPIRWRSSADAIRPLRVIETRRESDDVRSFVFADPNGAPLPDFEPGQHLPIELEMPGHTEPVSRTYSLSNAPGEGKYRISVKRESKGAASRFLHDAVEVGATIRSRAPAGDFVLEPGLRPVVCVSAGIGVTPMLAMLRSHVARGDSRSLHFLHVARDGTHHPFREEVRELVAAARNGSLHVSYSQPRSEDEAARLYDAFGRLDADQILSHVSELDSDFYLCGPVGFMAAISSGLEAAGVSPLRIHSESFGPSTTARG